MDHFSATKASAYGGSRREEERHLAGDSIEVRLHMPSVFHFPKRVYVSVSYTSPKAERSYCQSKGLPCDTPAEEVGTERGSLYASASE